VEAVHRRRSTGQYNPSIEDRILKVSRALTDLENSEHVQGNHLLEAINCRTLERRVWS
jgi:predicted ATPase with chaperone activity